MNQLGLSQEEGRELHAHLDVDGWQGLLAAQHTFTNAPMLEPSAGFADRVLQTLVVRERQRALRRRVIGAISFVLGSIIVTALLLWLSPLGALSQTSGWATLLNAVAWFIGFAVVLLELVATFVQVLAHLLGAGIALLLALFALLLTILWTRIVVGWTPLNRPMIV